MPRRIVALRGSSAATTYPATVAAGRADGRTRRAFFIRYGLDHDEAEYVLSTFKGVVVRTAGD